MSISKPHNLKLAKEQFYKDIQEDKDFLEFKEKAMKYHYGAVITSQHFLIELLIPTAQSIICQFVKTENTNL